MSFKPKSKTESKPRPAVMYVNKRDKKPTIFNLKINASECPEPDEKGVITLIGFVNDYKKPGDQQPDVKFQAPKPQDPATKKTFTPRQKDTEAASEDSGSDDWF